MKKHLRGRAQRGSVAVEFAIVFPMFIGLLGFTVSVGMGMWARYQLLSVATAAARVCAFQVPANPATMAGCVSQQVNAMTRGVNRPPCTGVEATSTIGNAPVPGSPMRILNVTITCQGSWMGGTSLVRSQLTGNYDISVRSAMPFMVAQGP